MNGALLGFMITLAGVLGLGLSALMKHEPTPAILAAGMLISASILFVGGK